MHNIHQVEGGYLLHYNKESQAHSRFPIAPQYKYAFVFGDRLHALHS